MSKIKVGVETQVSTQHAREPAIQRTSESRQLKQIYSKAEVRIFWLQLKVKVNNYSD